jgi:hypothetical protein
MIREILAETYTGFRREAVFPKEGDRLEASCSIGGEGRGLPDPGFENESPNAKRPRLRFERSHKAPPEAFPTHERRYVHPLEFGRLGAEEPEGAAADRVSASVNDQKRAAAAGYFLCIELKVVCARLRIQFAEFGVQGDNKATADLGCQLGASDRDHF